MLIRRLKSELTKPDGTPLYPERLVEEITVDYPLHEREVHALLKEYTADPPKTTRTGVVPRRGPSRRSGDIAAEEAVVLQPCGVRTNHGPSSQQRQKRRRGTEH